MRFARQVALTVVRWPVDSQAGSRRNALVAATALARQRRERDEVEVFLRRCAARREVREARLTALG